MMPVARRSQAWVESLYKPLNHSTNVKVMPVAWHAQAWVESLKSYSTKSIIMIIVLIQMRM